MLVSTLPGRWNTGLARERLYEAKARLLQNLPGPRPDWSRQEYRAICDNFLEMIRMLDRDIARVTGQEIDTGNADRIRPVLDEEGDEEEQRL